VAADAQALRGQVVVGFLATSGTGKTTLLERLIPELTSRGLAVGLVKHCSREFDIDHPGKDTYRLKRAGACRVAISNARLLGLVSDLSAPLSPEELARTHFADCDVVLVEGHRGAGIPKIIVERQGAPKGLIDAANLSGVVAEVNDLAEPRIMGVRHFGLEDIPALADFICREVPARSNYVAGVVLAGGKSSRLGTDKAEVIFEGSTLLERAARLLSGVCRELWVIGRRVPEPLASLGLRWHLDLFPQAGPLGGLYTALSVVEAPRCLVTGCDMPRLGEAALRALLAAPLAPAVVARGPGGRPEPLAAVYSKALLPRIDDLLRAGQLRLSNLFDDETRFVDFADDLFFNVNTPEDWAKLTG